MVNKKKIATGITIISAIIFCVALYRAVIYSPSDQIVLPEEVKEEINIEKSDLAAYPVRLTIPKIGVDTNVQQVGITKQRNMATPDNFSDVGWFKYGPLPGETGSAVLAGHVNNGIARPAVFYNLIDLKIGEEIYITTEGGAELRFLVSKIDTYDFDARETDVFTQKDGKLLKLITCTGNFVSKIGTHNKRLVVTAILSEN